MRRWSFFFACAALLSLICDSRCVARQASVAESPKLNQPAARPQGMLVRPKGGVQHPDLDKAWAEYDAGVADAYARVRAAIAKQFDNAAADGDLDAAERWQAALKRFDDNGQLPSESGTKNAVSEAVNGLKKAKDGLAEAYDEVVKALTREKKMAEAKAIREEAKAFGTSAPAAVNEPASTAPQNDSTPRSTPQSSPAARRSDEKPRAYDQVAEECKKAVERCRLELAGQYSSAIWSLKSAFQQEGALDKAIAADKEWTRAIDRKPLTPEDVVDTPEELKKLQKEYLAKWETVDEKTAKEFLAKLDIEASELAKKGKLAEGRVLQEEIAQIKRLYLIESNDKSAGAPQPQEDPVAACEEAIRQKRVAAQAQYVGELEAMEKSFQAQGDLEGVFAAKAEKKRFMDTPLLADENLVEKPDTLRELQQKYLELQQNVTTSVAEEFIAKLEQLKQALTIEGKLEEAVTAKAAAEKVRQQFILKETTASTSGSGWKDITALMTGGKKRGNTIVLQEQFQPTSEQGLFENASPQCCLSTKNYVPPLEIEYVCSTSKDNIRLVYACRQLVFSWEVNPDELRIDGGPASGRHVQRAGYIPRNKMVTIRQVVLGDQMSVYVDGQLRASWNGDFSDVNEPIGVYGGNLSEVKVQRIRVKELRK